METLRPLLPDKDFFNIGETCRIVQIPAHTLRYWESRFHALRPVRRESGHRRYTRKDLETILEIKDLLHKRKMTVEGARKTLIARQKGQSQAAGPHAQGGLQPAAVKLLREVREELRRILQDLK